MKSDDQNSYGIMRMLHERGSDNQAVFDGFLRLIYDQLDQPAARYPRWEGSDHTLQPTALINEVYLKLIGQPEVDWKTGRIFSGLPPKPGAG